MVVADEEGQGEEEDHDGTQDDHQHHLVRQPAVHLLVGDGDLVPDGLTEMTDGLQVDIVGGALLEDLVSDAEVTDVVVVGLMDGVAVNFGVTSVCNNSILTSRDEMLMRLRVLLFDNIQLTYPDVEGVVVGWLPPGEAESLAGDGSCGRKQYLYLFSF